MRYQLRRDVLPAGPARGIALILVLWLLVLLAVLLGTFAVLARTESLQSRHLFETTSAHYGAQAALSRAIYELAQPDPLARWVPDGRPYEFEFEGMQLRVNITDEGGKIDLNAADQVTLTNLFVSLGLDMLDAQRIADAILDWRDADDLTMPNGAEDADYAAAGYPYGAKDGPFDTVSELQQVMGMSYELFRRAEPALTIYSGQTEFNPSFAPLEALRSLPGMSDELAQEIIAQRHGYDPATGLPPLLPDGRPLSVEGGSGTYSILARATLPNRSWSESETTVRLGGFGASGLAYTVLQWRDGETL